MKIYRRRSRKNWHIIDAGHGRAWAAVGGVLFVLAFRPLHAQSLPSDESAGANGNDHQKLEEIVVTGVFQRIKKEEATVAVSTVDTEQIENLVSQSAAELAANVPGVFVNSAHGEIRNVIYSRGVSANSLDTSAGYYYVAMEEDGLPVTNVTWVNFGPDYFLRADATVDRLEAVRGGAAAVTGPNAPGGIFNYISKRGGDDHAGQLTVRTGLEGDGLNPYYRGDVWLGGPIASGWTYSIGGFFRRSDGSQYPRFPLNEGGQLKFNVTRDFDQGYLQLYGKYLDDTNGFANFIPAVDFGDPRPAPGWSIASNPTPPRTAFRYQVGPNEFDTFDSSRLQRNTSKVVGVRFEKTFGNDWTLKNDMKYSDNDVVWNSWIGILPQSVTDIFTPVFYGTLGILGDYTYLETTSGRAAHVNQSDILTATVTDSNLPMHDRMPGGVLASIALDFRPSLTEFMDQIAVSKEFDDMSFTLGAFVSLSDTSVLVRTPGFGVTTIEPDPLALDLSIQTPAGEMLQVTNPVGVGPPIGNNMQRAEWDQVSVFFGHRWNFTPDWAIDWGVRAERIDVSVTNPVPGSAALVVSATGGPDGNPSTLFDNRYVSDPSSFFTFHRRVTNESYTAALSRRLGSRQSIYLRYSNGAKAPDLGIFYAQVDPATVHFVNTSSQEIEQFELGYKYAGPSVSVVLTPYFSLLDNVRSTQTFVNPVDGSLYLRISTNALESYGVEFESDWTIGGGFSLQTALTWQKATNTKQFTWVQGPTPEQDVLVDQSGGKADSNPDAMVTITPSYTNERFHAQVQWRYMGERPGNANNAFMLPGFHTTNLRASWKLTPQISVAATVNNAFNNRGVMTFTVPASNLVAGLNRQSLTAEQVQADAGSLFTILPIQSRAYYLEMNYRF